MSMEIDIDDMLKQVRENKHKEYIFYICNL